MIQECSGFFRFKSRKLLQVSFKKRTKSNSIFSPMSVAHVDDEDLAGPGTAPVPGPGPGNLYQEYKVFNNGEFYNGQWLDSLPHGHGKYLWNDGCEYVGEWRKGRTKGKGKFTWPSGATYEGNFKNGFMDGKGTYTGSNGETYRGLWSSNFKHGQGTMNYANRDHYEGEWRRGVQEGNGRYIWKNGHVFVGQWKNGAIHGKGALTWANGNKFDGYWVNGLPNGYGSYKWVDGSYYIGSWDMDPNEQSGTYYPAKGSSVPGNIDWEPQDVFKIEMEECKVSSNYEKITMLLSQKMVGYDLPSVHKPSMGICGRLSVDGRLSNCSNMSNMSSMSNSFDRSYEGRRNSVDAFGRLSVDHTPRGFHPVLLPKTIKKQGFTICKGHKNFELMLNLQLGVRHSVGRPAPPINLDLKSSAFDPKEKYWTRFPPEGSKHTPPHPSCEFKWKDYCPLVFRTLRKLFKVDAADYMLSICGNDALRELSSPGKSGSFFYLTLDDKYMIKTIKKAEVKVLLRMLPAYYNHVRTFEDTLVTRFYGLHCVKLTGAQKKVRFVIMGNLFCTEYAIHRRFDLKGSSHGRTTEKPQSEIDPTTTLKDLDLSYIFRLQRFWFQEFCRQVDRDCDFLEQERIMDYSLLVGVHFRDSSVSRPMEEGNGKANTDLVAPRLSRVDETDRLAFDPTQWASIRLGINMPARAEVTVRRTDCEAQLVGDPTGECYDVIVFFGIIDILQDYDISKKLEHAYKSIQHDPTSISAVDPKQYSKRFRDFIFKVFAENG